MSEDDGLLVVQPNATEFRWDKRREEAALLVAKDEQTDLAIAAACKIHKVTLERWKKHPEFAARVQEHRDAWRREIKVRGIAERQNRVDSYNDLHDRMQRVIEARAIEHADVPGGDTGLLVRQAKLVKVYKSDERPPVDGDDDDGETLYSAKRDVIVYEYAVDTALLKEMREHKKQVAQDTGQWTEKQEHSGEILVRQYVGVDVDGV